MKNLHLASWFWVLVFLLPSPAAKAVMVIDHIGAVEETVAAPTMTKKQRRQMARIEKHMAQHQQAPKKERDPVDKWMWNWLISWLVGIVLVMVGLYLLDIFSLLPGIIILLGLIAFFVGTVNFIIWLIKMLS